MKSNKNQVKFFGLLSIALFILVSTMEQKTGTSSSPAFGLFASMGKLVSPTKLPSDFKEVLIGKTEIKLSWDEANQQGTNFLVTYFLKKAGQKESRGYIVEVGSNNNLHLTGLLPSTQYRLVLGIKKPAGIFDIKEITVNTKEAPEGELSILKAAQSELGSKTVHLDWTEMNKSEEVKVVYAKDGENFPLDCNMPNAKVAKSKGNDELNNLELNQRYNIRLCSISEKSENIDAVGLTTSVYLQ